MFLRMVSDFILVEPDNVLDITKGGVVIPQRVREKQPINNQPPTGTVMAVGPGVLLPSGERVPLYVKPGDRVLFDPRAGKDFTNNDVRLFLCKEDAIMGVREDADALVSPGIKAELAGE